MSAIETPSGSVRVTRPVRPGYDTILTREALSFVADLAREFSPRIAELLERRRARQASFDAGERPRFLPETRHIREGDWHVGPVPPDLQDRRVEITGPVSRKMVINALNSGANVFMADFEDATSPTFANLVEGQINLYEAVRRTIALDDPASGKSYRLTDHPAVLLVRPRGWHLTEAHVQLDGERIPGALFDFGLYFYHNASALLERGSGPYFYLPKLESHLEARLWNDVFVRAQNALGLPQGTIKATVLVETLPASFELHEILWELRDHIVGLNCGRWDYIFSYIKTFRAHPEHVTPDRGQITMTQPFMRAYTQLVVQTCHRRGAHAMGGMAAQIPIKHDPEANEAALARVRADKLREVQDGHDGTWVAHPGLVPVAKAVFDEHMPGPNQVANLREDFHASEADLIAVPPGSRTEAGLRNNLSVAVQYLAAWLGGNGCVPIANLMEDAATAEISRTQVWQWLRHGADLEDGGRVTPDLVNTLLDEEAARIREAVGRETYDRGHFAAAKALVHDLVHADGCEDFLTLPAYEQILQMESETEGALS